MQAQTHSRSLDLLRDHDTLSEWLFVQRVRVSYKSESVNLTNQHSTYRCLTSPEQSRCLYHQANIKLEGLIEKQQSCEQSCPPLGCFFLSISLS